MFSSDYFRVFHQIDNKLWQGKVETNPLLSTLIVLSIAILGGCVSGGKTLHEWFNWNVGISLYEAAATSVVLYGCLLVESIVATRTPAASLTRSLLYFGVCLVAFGAGYLLALIVLFIIAIYLIITLILAAIGEMVNDLTHPSVNSSSSSREFTRIDEVKLEDGTRLTRENNGDWKDDYGRAWDEKNDGFEKR